MCFAQGVKIALERAQIGGIRFIGKMSEFRDPAALTAQCLLPQKINEDFELVYRCPVFPRLG